jgi:Iron-containing redox enzyme
VLEDDKNVKRIEESNKESRKNNRKQKRLSDALIQKSNHSPFFSGYIRSLLEQVTNTSESIPAKDVRKWYVNEMIKMYSIMRASVPLMAKAELESVSKDIPELTEYYNRHIQEEMHHDEWLLDDLESIGIDPERVKKSTTGKELVGTQYYFIYHQHPVSLMGYIAFLEGNPPKVEAIDRLQKLTKFPDTAFRVMRKHSTLDIHHKKELDDTLDSLPLTEQYKEWIAANAVYSKRKFNTL